jgi:hypothetical protein
MVGALLRCPLGLVALSLLVSPSFPSTFPGPKSSCKAPCPTTGSPGAMVFLIPADLVRAVISLVFRPRPGLPEVPFCGRDPGPHI